MHKVSQPITLTTAALICTFILTMDKIKLCTHTLWSSHLYEPFQRLLAHWGFFLGFFYGLYVSCFVRSQQACFQQRQTAVFCKMPKSPLCTTRTAASARDAKTNNKYGVNVLSTYTFLPVLASLLASLLGSNQFHQ